MRYIISALHLIGVVQNDCAAASAIQCPVVAALGLPSWNAGITRLPPRRCFRTVGQSLMRSSASSELPLGRNFPWWRGVVQAGFTWWLGVAQTFSSPDRLTEIRHFRVSSSPVVRHHATTVYLPVRGRLAAPRQSSDQQTGRFVDCRGAAGSAGGLADEAKRFHGRQGALRRAQR